MSCREQAGIRARLWPNPSAARFAGRPGVLHEPAGQLVAVFIAIVLRWRWRMLSRCSRAGGCADAPSQRLEDRVAAGSRVERRCTALCEPVVGQRTGKARGWMLAGACGRVLPGMAVAELAPAAPSCLHPSIPDGICGAMGVGSAVGVSNEENGRCGAMRSGGAAASRQNLNGPISRAAEMCRLRLRIPRDGGGRETRPPAARSCLIPV
jgi:hypothetical protein